ncbi:MAG: glycerate kinase [Oscillospiraceae bacterium]|nr:glycerate kinase [Oscillospiraceae bacterium]
MKKVILAPDSFKGTLSAMQICSIMQEEIRSIYPKCRILSIPVADGGEGTVDSFLQAVKGEKIPLRVKGPYFDEIDSFYGLIDGGRTAVIEMAAAAGLPLAKARKDPSVTTTYGVGQLMRHALSKGARNIVIGMGGSCTNDGGSGMAAAMGVEFSNSHGDPFIPVGGTLHKIAKIECARAAQLLQGVKVRAMCDVDNPLHGENGAAFVFAPQKGADMEMVRLLDDNLRFYERSLQRWTGKKDAGALPGSGAAGGLGAGAYALFNAQLAPGIDLVLETVKFDDLLSGCDIVFTGEGRLDGQSLRGKAVTGIARKAKTKKVPVCAVVGDVLDDGVLPVYEAGVSAIFSTNRLAVPFSEAKTLAAQNLKFTMKNILALMKAVDGLQTSI